MKWIFKKLIIVLIEALVVAGLLDALGIDLKGLLDELKAGLEEEETTTAAEDSTVA